jgi:hypothetical protein
MLKKIIIAMIFYTNCFASHSAAPLQRASSIKNSEQMTAKLLSFRTMLEKIDAQQSKAQLTTDDYHLIKNTVYNDVETLLGRRGRILLQIEIEQSENCYTSCMQGAVVLYKDLLSSGYQGSAEEKRHAHDDCKHIIQVALDTLKFSDSRKTESSVMKRD